MANMPEAEVEDLLHLGVGHVARGLHLGEDARLVPGAPGDDRVAVRGSTRARFAGDPTTGDVRERVDRHTLVAAPASQARRSRWVGATRRRACDARRATQVRRAGARRVEQCPPGQ